MHFESFLFTAEVVLPVAFLLTLGYILRLRRFTDENFIRISSKLVFNLTLPALVFLAISNATIDPAQNVGLIGFVATAIVATFVIASLWARVAGIKGSDGRAFVQASFRSNLGIIGIAMAVYAFGDEGKEIGALVLAVGVPAYNLLSVVILSSGQGIKWGGQLGLIVRNPLIISIVAALLVRYSHLNLPGPLTSFLGSLGDMTLALALISVGGTLDLEALKKANFLTAQIALLKLIIFPALVSVAAYLLGFSGVELGVIALMIASPTAAAAFVMAQAMKANHVLTANAIAVTTLASLVSMGLIVYVLKAASLV